MPSSDDRARILFYTTAALVNPANHELPGVKRFTHIFKLFGANYAFVDRTRTLRSPTRTAIWGPMPAFRRMTKTYEQICNERAVDLLARVEALNVPLYLLYSGGIDSTLVLISLLKNAKPGQLDRLIILLTQESIAENPSFFHENILGKFKIQMATTYPFLLNKKGVFICGELNDQVMGSDVACSVATNFGSDKIQAKYDRDLFFKLWTPDIKDPKILNWYLDQFEKVKAIAPIPIETNFDYLWWLNFSFKWQSVVFRIVSYLANYNLPSFDKEFFDTHFCGFFGTEDFQLWTMNNMDKKIQNTWESYKFTAKDVIYEFTKDDNYRRTKTKQSSLYLVILHQVQQKFITDDYKMHLALPPEDWYEPDNSFRDA